MSGRRPLAEAGRALPRVDALAKATGTERYAADFHPEGLAMSGFLWAGAVRAGAPSARLLDVDLAHARALPGVVAALTAADAPGPNLHGIVHQDQPVLAGDRVRHAGEAVALLVAEDRAALARALAAVRVSLERTPGVFDAAAALAPGAPLLHEDRPRNILSRAVIETGRGARALRHCAVKVRGRFVVPVQKHAFLEPEAGLARLGEDGVLEIVASTQSPFRDRFEVARALGLDPGRVRVRAPYLGGGFGGKDGATVQCLLALAAISVPGRWVKMVWDREESALAGCTRHAATVQAALGADADGTFQAYACRVVYDTGGYAHLGAEVMELGMEHAAGPYRLPNTRVLGLCVHANNPVAGAMRGFGVVQTAFAIEGLVDELARRLGRDPLGLRLQNALRRGDRNAAGVTMVDSTGMTTCLETLRRDPWHQDAAAWKAQAPAFVRRGTSLCAVWNAMGYGRGLADAATARLELTETGRFRIYNGVADMGQGNAAGFVQMAGEALCQEAEAFELVQPDTFRCLPSGSSSAGRTSFTFGNALLRACEALRRRLFLRAAMALLADRDDEMVMIPGAVRHLPTGRDLPLAAMGRLMTLEDRTATAEYVMPVALDPATAGTGFAIGFPHRFFAFAAVQVWVEVDELTGRTRVVRALSVTDGGRVLNPLNVEQQVSGALLQGLGLALMEDQRAEEGRVLARDLSTYLVPTFLDAPETRVVMAASEEPAGPLGLKGVGEVNVNAGLPAVAAAIADALDARRADAAGRSAGTRLRQAPFWPWRVLEVMKEMTS